MKGKESTCEIRVGDASFSACASSSGVVSLELAPLDGAVRSLAEKSPVRPRVLGAPRDATAAMHLESLASFLAQLLAGEEPEVVPGVDLSTDRCWRWCTAYPGAPCPATGRSPQWPGGPAPRARSEARSAETRWRWRYHAIAF